MEKDLMLSIDKNLSITYLSISIVLANAVVACVWLREFYRNPQAGNPIKYVIIACVTSEILALVCVAKLFRN